MEYSSRGGLFNYQKISNIVSPIPPEPVLLVDDSEIYIVTDDGTFIQIV